MPEIKTPASKLFVGQFVKHRSNNVLDVAVTRVGARITFS